MANIKKIKIIGLRSTHTWAALNVRFYTSGGLFQVGTLTTNSYTLAEFTNLKVTFTQGYDHTYFYPSNAFNTAKSQTPSTYTNACYLIISSSASNQIECTFTTAVQLLSKIEFNCVPGDEADHITAYPFTVEAYNELDSLVRTYTVTPVTSPRNAITTLNTPELIESYSTEITEVVLPVVDTSGRIGITKVEVTDSHNTATNTTITSSMIDGGVLGSGRVWSVSLNRKAISYGVVE